MHISNSSRNCHAEGLDRLYVDFLLQNVLLVDFSPNV